MYFIPITIAIHHANIFYNTDFILFRPIDNFLPLLIVSSNPTLTRLCMQTKNKGYVY